MCISKKGNLPIVLLSYNACEPRQPGALLLDLKPIEQEENHAWKWKPHPIPRVREAMDLGEEPTTTALLSQYNP